MVDKTQEMLNRYCYKNEESNEYSLDMMKLMRHMDYLLNRLNEMEKALKREFPNIKLRSDEFFKFLEQEEKNSIKTDLSSKSGVNV